MSNEFEKVEQLMLRPEAIFVFGSNMAGIHGAGAAKTALDKYGAVWGCGEGLQGRSYAVPTKNRWLNVLPLEEISLHTHHLWCFAWSHPDFLFVLTRFGTGLAGYSDEEMIFTLPPSSEDPPNLILPDLWKA